VPTSLSVIVQHYPLKVSLPAFLPLLLSQSPLSFSILAAYCLSFTRHTALPTLSLHFVGFILAAYCLSRGIPPRLRCLFTSCASFSQHTASHAAYRPYVVSFHFVGFIFAAYCFHFPQHTALSSHFHSHPGRHTLMHSERQIKHDLGVTFYPTPSLHTANTLLIRPPLSRSQLTPPGLLIPAKLPYFRSHLSLASRPQSSRSRFVPWV
jgi:hypothetical protein